MCYRNTLFLLCTLRFNFYSPLCFLEGFILKFPIWGDPADDNCYDDEVYWEVRMPFHHKVEFFSF